MNIGAVAVSPNKVVRDAEENYRGGFFCCEALMGAVCDNFDLDVADDVVAMSSAMAVGMGRSGCVCGALNGGVMALGMFFGRTTPDGPADPKVRRAMALSNELHDWFRANNGKSAVCCRVLTRGMDMAAGEHRGQCIVLTGLCAWKVADVVCRELAIENLDG
ncbi:C-GCAxxG-C-C family protein [Olsenella sp. CU969]|uniref:C-GCAxxG-C-C family protein n=1 Tax=Olsenella sp. CU969 TaxID=2780101 RepID=UPI001956E49D|nr:C-GCAxxG-C-C family protein [Olsenella sp. CU969]MBF0600258.1 C_GCAxxG_C_C family protein [Atopobiaceae bacterium FL090493]